MINKGLLIVAVFVLIAAVLGACLWIDAQSSLVESTYVYEGKEIMTEEDYTEFKTVVARKDIDIKTLNTYSSNNPLVIFRVEVPVDLDFKWGEIKFTRYIYPSDWHILYTFMFWLGGFLGLVLLFTALGWNE